MNKEIKEHIEDIKKTLIARIIPNMPLKGDTREYTTKIINEFEFDWYFKKIQKQTAEEILNKLINDLEEGEGLTPNDKMWIQNLIKKYNKLKKEYRVKENE